MTDESDIIETGPQSSDDLGAQIEAARQEVMAKHQPTETTDTTAASSDLKAEIKQAADRARDESGRFVKGETAPAKAAAKKPTDAPPPAAPAAAPNAPAPAAAAPSTPPNSLSATIKAKWAQIDPEVRAEFERREADAHKMATKFDEERAFARQVRQLIGPHEQMFRAAGLDTMSALNALINAQATFERGSPQQRAALMAQLARQYQIDLGQVQQVPAPDPQVHALQQELAQMRSQWQQFQTQSQQQQQSSVAAEIEAFAQDPAHPHFNAVQADMAALFQSGLVGTLQEAYDRAVWGNPQTRSAIQAAELAAQESQRKAEEAQRAQAAKRRAVSVTGAPGLAQTAAISVPDRSLEDELKHNMAAALGRF